VARMYMSETSSWNIANFDAGTIWAGRPAIYAHIEAAIDGLPEFAPLAELALPDEGQLHGGRRGAGGLGAKTGVEQDERLRAKQIAKALRDSLDAATPPNLRHLTRLLTRAPVLGVLDDVLAELVGSGDLEPDRFHALAMFLVCSAPDREVLKLGISMLGVLVGCDERETLLSVGRHEEFTLFAAVALSSTLESPGAALWTLARGVRAWGRIHAVERLGESDDPEIQAWLLREGFKNEVMDEYLVHVCAVAGDLAGALEADIIDDALLEGAAGLLGGLLSVGPTESIEDYDQAPQASTGYLRHLVRHIEGAGRPLNLRHLLVIEQLREFISPVGEELEDDELLSDLGWTMDVRREVLDMCAGVGEWSAWRAQVETGLGEDDPEVFYQADAAAQLLGVDSWPRHLERVEANPHSPHSSASWFRLLQTTDDERFAQALARAQARMPLTEIAAGPAEESGIGPEFDTHDTLLVIIDALVDRPGRGVALIEAALASPVTRVRRGVLQVLSAWDEEGDEVVRAVLGPVVGREPDAELAADMGKVLAGASPEQP